MKKPLLLLTLFLTALPAMADEAVEHYKNGMRLKNQGEVEEARVEFEKALQLRPNDGRIKFQLTQLKQMAPQLHANKRMRELSKVNIPRVDFDAVNLSDALMALGAMVEAESAKKEGKDKAFHPNFMLQDPSGKLANQEITLRLSAMPANVVLKYMLEQSSAMARYDKHAIIICPATIAPAAPAAPEEKPEFYDPFDTE